MAGQLLGSNADSFESPLTVLASPAWRGVEADVWRAKSGSQSLIVKHFHDDTKDYVDHEKAIIAAQEAGRLGVGPEVVDISIADSMFVMEDLNDGWTAGGLQHAAQPGLRAKIIELKKAFQKGAALDHQSSILDEIQVLYGKAQACQAVLHTDCGVFIDYFRDAQSRIESLGIDQNPCHRDGNTANLMVHETGNVRLIDFDLAARADPFEDIGCYLAEFFESDADARPGFEEWYGTFDEGLFQRARIYGLADDMRWGLIGSIMAKTSPRKSLEFGKYASWRFLRLEGHLKRSDANDRLRRAA